MDPRWKHPFPALVAGPTCCGKIQFVKRLLEAGEDMIDVPRKKSSGVMACINQPTMKCSKPFRTLCLCKECLVIWKP